jgi:hypothetical protein
MENTTQHAPDGAPDNVSEATSSAVETGDEFSNLSTDELISRYRLSEDVMGLEQIQILMHIMSRDIPESTREALLQDYAQKNFHDTREVLDVFEVFATFGVTPENTRWFGDMLERFVYEHPAQIAALQPLWPEEPPKAEDATYLERRLEQYNQFRAFIQTLDTPEGRAVMDILDSTESWYVKVDLMFFLQDITNGTMDLPEATHIIQDEARLFDYLLKQAQQTSNPSVDLVERIQSLTNYHPEWSKRLKDIPGFK